MTKALVGLGLGLVMVLKTRGGFLHFDLSDMVLGIVGAALLVLARCLRRQPL